ncbi:MAG: hypothetical protein ACI8P9_005555 [Parasphingorhabdus sp.]
MGYAKLDWLDLLNFISVNYIFHTSISVKTDTTRFPSSGYTSVDISTNWRRMRVYEEGLRQPTGLHFRPCAWHLSWDRNRVVRLMAPTVGAAECNQPFMMADTAL